jgi:uncharacterized protein
MKAQRTQRYESDATNTSVEFSTPHPSKLDDDRDLDPRYLWATIRGWMELDKYKQLRHGGKKRNHWDLFESLVKLFGVGVRMVGLWDRGVRNALDVELREHSLYFDNLPAAFDGYRILHITDPHFDSLPQFGQHLAEKIADINVDCCFFTGDYRKEIHGSYRQILPDMKQIVDALDCKDGVYATLGNHDTVHMVNPFEAMGVKVLANETITLNRGNDRIIVTGVDDVHYFYTDMTMEAFQSTEDGFKIALVHSPELFDMVEANNYSLYLAGHTHGGQICLPGGRPLIMHLSHGKEYAVGLWKYNKLQGYTSNGAGTSCLPIRFHSRGDITV